MPDFTDRTKALCRSAFLSEPVVLIESAVSSQPVAISQLGIQWLTIRGVSDFADKYTPDHCASLMERVLNGLARSMTSLAVQQKIVLFRLKSGETGVSLQIGCAGSLIDVLKSSLNAIYPGVDIQLQSGTDASEVFRFGGVLTGYATMPPENKDASIELPLDSLLRGMGRSLFSLSVCARLIDPAETEEIHQRLSLELGAAANQAEQQLAGADGVTGKSINQSAKVYQTELEKTLNMCEYARRTAMWDIQLFYAASTNTDADRMGGLLCSALNGNADSVSEAVACRRVASNNGRLIDFLPGILSGYAQLNLPQTSAGAYSFPGRNPLSTYAGSRELSRLLALPRNEYAGYYVNQFVQFDVDNRPAAHTGEYHLGSIVRTCQANAPIEGSYTVDPDVLTRHALIIGLTGGGKTNTGKGLLKALWLNHQIPFLVIESAKREYWEMSALADEKDNNHLPFKDINVFTLGDENPETASPFRINPMEAMPGVSLQSHIDYLLSTFKAAFELYPPMPYVLETAVYKVYEDRGWDIVTGKNKFGFERYPMLSDLYDAIEVVTDSLRYHSEVQSNVKAALKARIGSLMIGGKNYLMNTPKSMDMRYLLSRPTVLELEDLGDDDTKAFVIGILLVRIYEYHKSIQFDTENRRGGGKSLRHVIMIEEAHRLLKNVQGGGEGNQTREKAVEFFCNMLAEIRSFGQAFFIADQVPTKLAPDTLKNTNLKIIHRTVMEEDRLAVGKAMNMTTEQIEYLSALRVGHAAVFGEGDNRPKLVRFPLQVNRISPDRRSFIRQCSSRIRQECPGIFTADGQTEACRWCPDCCRYKEKIQRFLDEYGVGSVMDLFEAFSSAELSGKSLLDTVDSICPEMSKEEKLCLAGFILRSSSVKQVEQRKVIADMVSRMAQH